MTVHRLPVRFPARKGLKPSCTLARREQTDLAGCPKVRALLATHTREDTRLPAQKNANVSQYIGERSVTL